MKLLNQAAKSNPRRKDQDANLGLVRDEDDALPDERVLDHLLEERLGDVRVNGRKGIVQQVHVPVTVEQDNDHTSVKLRN